MFCKNKILSQNGNQGMMQDHKAYPKNGCEEIFGLGPWELGPSLTPRVSLGTKILSQKIFSYDPIMILFYVFCSFFMPNLEFYAKNS